MSVVPVGLAGLAAVVATRVPGSPGGVRALAASWRRSGDTVGEGASLMSSAGSSAPSWQGVSAQAFSAAVSSLSGELSGRAGELGRGAGVMDAYAGVLERAHGMAAELRAQAARLLVTSIASPAAAPACQVVATVITTTFNTLLSTVDLAAATAAASLGTAASAGPGGGKNGGAAAAADSREKDKKRLQHLVRQMMMAPFGLAPFSEEDIARLREQADGKGDWDPDANQRGIGDCYLLATLQGYSRTEDGQQKLRDHVRWDEGKGCFVVTLYDNGKPVDVDVDDYYSGGTKDHQGRPTLMSIYERAYGQHFGFQDLADGGRAVDTIPQITHSKSYSVDTWGSEPGWFGLTFPKEDHKYDQSEWNNIKSAVDSGQVVVASTRGGSFGNGDTVNAATDTNGDGKIDTKNPGVNGEAPDQETECRLVGGDYDHDSKTEKSSHAYTVVDIDDEYVTLRNPWGGNDTPNDGRKDGGLIRITREDYEKHFARTDIGQVP